MSSVFQKSIVINNHYLYTRNFYRCLYHQKRSITSIREIQTRLKSIQNTKKITDSMKLIATNKLENAEKSLNIARQIGNSFNTYFKNIKATDKISDRNIIIAVGSDKGLCGGVNTSVSRALKFFVEDDNETNNIKNSKTKSLKKQKSNDDHDNDNDNDNEYLEQPNHRVFIIGDKIKSQVAKNIPNHIEMIYSGIGGKKQSSPTFYEVCLICDDINYVMQEKLLNSEVLEDDSYDEIFDSGFILFNRYINSVSYEITTLPVYTRETIINSPNLFTYKYDEDIFDELQEFAFAINLYWALSEGYMTELSSRKYAMENSSRNAKEIINNLIKSINHSRQTHITNELIDISTGANNYKK
ncbi:F1 complex, gamma subunit of ATPase [Anaeromyces robustus]|uniref:F1 complex, gamma subunit of ATPase n=1 Tax=Anaeromyces robustus TaxID=1754192 RepID=A0A1Y1WY77_9FUNG|nr:F1 complex, gamma subunit of ATPase [Anaeromyces robustus]|eukprot:ORX78402.1 F1 complex, gamma subunit of ATPase [Anaeromyces robustus]